MSVCVSSNPYLVENNITFQMDEAETLSFVKKNDKKYSKAHLHEIANALAKADEKIRIVSFNVLFSKGDSFLKPQNRWENRKFAVIESIRQMDPDILGVQEPLDPQVEFLKENLNEYFYFGSKDNCDMNLGIFFKKDRFVLIDQNAFHLESSSIDFTHVTQSQSWESKKKELIHLKLMDKKTAQVFHIFNVHLSFFSTDWREMDAHVTHQKAREILDQEGDLSHVVIMGDCNTFPSRIDTTSLPFWDGQRVEKIIKGVDFLDADQEAILGHMGPISTFTNDPNNSKAAPFCGHGTPGVILDHIFISKKITPLIYAVNPITVEGEFPSDHMPVVLDLVVNAL